MGIQISNKQFSFTDPSLQKLFIKRRIVDKKIKNIDDEKNLDSRLNKMDYTEKIKKKLEKNHLDIAKKKIEDELRKIRFNKGINKSDQNNYINDSNPYKRFIKDLSSQDCITYSVIDIYI